MTAAQYTDERIRYRQEIVDDTVSSAVWAASGGTLSGQSDGSTYSTILFTAASPGTYSVTCSITTASGQIRKGRIDVTVTNI